MLGRGSRSRGICEGILYKVTKDKTSIVIDKLKKQNFAAMNDLEGLLKLLEYKQKDGLLQGILMKAWEAGAPLMSLAMVEKSMTSKQYGKLIAGFRL
jgi:CRISPR/Cas system CMR-associated protein Cmr1 (group 7 of RAMP superfamily)